MADLDLRELRLLVITAIFSDDTLMDTLVLKGGNALNLVHNVSRRASFDLDFSMGEDFDDLEEIGNRLEEAITARLNAKDYQPFDFDFSPRPKKPTNPKWGGYRLEFKVVDTPTYEAHRDDLKGLRNRSKSLGKADKKRMKVEISRYEHVDGKAPREIDDLICYVYPLEMIAMEKLRALCQQMEAYEMRTHRTPRARDFYDIHAIVEVGGIDLLTPENRDLLRAVFEAKQVPVSLLEQLQKEREFHRADWPAVVDTTPDLDNEYDFYFDYVVELVDKLDVFIKS